MKILWLEFPQKTMDPLKADVPIHGGEKGEKVIGFVISRVHIEEEKAIEASARTTELVKGVTITTYGK